MKKVFNKIINKIEDIKIDTGNTLLVQKTLTENISKVLYNNILVIK